RDTLIDNAIYSVMTIMWMDAREAGTFGGTFEEFVESTQKTFGLMGSYNKPSDLDNRPLDKAVAEGLVEGMKRPVNFEEDLKKITNVKYSPKVELTEEFKLFIDGVITWEQYIYAVKELKQMEAEAKPI